MTLIVLKKLSLPETRYFSFQNISTDGVVYVGHLKKKMSASFSFSLFKLSYNNYLRIYGRLTRMRMYGGHTYRGLVLLIVKIVKRVASQYHRKVLLNGMKPKNNSLLG